MSNNSSVLIKNIQELICILDDDFDNYKDVLDQIIAEITKVSKHTDALITFINSQLSNSESRRKGLILLQILLPICPEEYLEENAIAWLNNSLKNCQYHTCINDEAYIVITALLEICHKSPELNKCVTSGIMSKVLESITRIYYGNVETIHALKCLETCLRIYPGSCVPFKTSIDKFLLSFVDYTKSNIVIRLVGKCFHLFQQIGGGGSQGINYRENWKNQQIIVCATIQSLMDNLFESIMEMGLVQQDIISVLPLPKLPIGERFKLNSNRLINLILFLQEMLLGSFPTVKCISPTAILNVICRGLAVTSATLGQHILNEAISLASHLHIIDKHLLHLLQALIISLGCNLIPYAPTICKTILNNLKCTKAEDARHVKPFCDLRLTAYETLSLWMTTAKSASCVHMHADSLIAIIITDVSPLTINQINLTVQSNIPKHMSKKGRKKLQQEQISQSNIAKNYSPVTKKSSNNKRNIYQIKICCEALETLQTILLTSGHFLKPVVHKQLQEFVIKLLLNVQAGIVLNPYDDAGCKLLLYKILTMLVTNHHWNMSPPLCYAIQILSKGQSDLDSRISAGCSSALSSLNSFIHPSCTTLQFPLDLENLKTEFNLEPDKNTDEILINSESEYSESSEEKEDDSQNNIEINGIPEAVQDTNDKIVEVIDVEQNGTSAEISNSDPEEENGETATKKAKIEEVHHENIETNGTKAEESVESLQIEISDDETEEMTNLTIAYSPEAIIEDDIKNKIKTTSNDKEQDVIDLEEEDLLGSFVDIVNE